MKIFFLLLLSLLPFSDLKSDQSYEFTFSDGVQGWTGDFCDYPVGEESFFELAWGWENLPVEISDSSKGLFLSGNNHSDDLFMFFKRELSGLQPNTEYSVAFSVVLETATPSGISVGIGGSPGKSVFVKVGASTEEPRKVIANHFYRLSVDKGNQAQGGLNALVIGDLENASPNPFDPHYFPKQLEQQSSLIAKSDSEGRLWVFLGTDSGFEGLTRFYIARISIEMQAL